MQASIGRDLRAPLVLAGPVPEPGPGQITVRTEASGLCHTDIHAANGDWPVKPTPPFVPGHEGVGTVHAIGRGVSAFELGERAAVPWLGYACGTCKHCLTGWETLCLQQCNSGCSLRRVLPRRGSRRREGTDGIDPFDAAPLLDLPSGIGAGAPAFPPRAGYRRRRPRAPRQRTDAALPGAGRDAPGGAPPKSGCRWAW